MKTRRILIIFLAITLLIPFKTVLGVDVTDDEEERDLVKALVLMAARSDAANGGVDR